MKQSSLISLTPKSFFSLEGFSHSSLFEECAYVWQALAKLKSYMQQQKLYTIAITLPEHVHFVNQKQITIGADTVIEPGVYIEGPCIIGKGCTIRHGAYIRPYSLIGDGCVIGHDTEVKHSIFLNRSFAAHFNYVGDSIIGNGVNLGAGVKCANYRFDHQDVVIAIDGQKYETYLKKMGAIVGDEAQVGCNAVLNPGTLIGKRALCYPCLNVHGYIPEGAKVKPSHSNCLETLSKKI